MCVSLSLSLRGVVGSMVLVWGHIVSPTHHTILPAAAADDRESNGQEIPDPSFDIYIYVFAQRKPEFAIPH